MKKGPARRIIGGATLLGSGVASGLGLIAIVSNRVHLIDPPVAVSLVLFLQWQAMGLTIAKVGIDQVVFARISGDPRVRPDVADHLKRRAGPLALVFSVAMATAFPAIVSALCAVSLLLDTASIIIASDLNARERFSETSVASLLNYPAFFVGLLVASAWTDLRLGGVVVLFVLSSGARLAFLLLRARTLLALPSASLTPTWQVGVQQALNYVLFRGDQLLLATAVGAHFVATAGADALRNYLFLARYPDLVSSVVVTLGPVLLPGLFLDRTVGWAEAKHRVLGGSLAVVVYVIVVGAPMILYPRLWSGPPSTLSPVPFGLGAVLILPANVLTYSLLRRGALRPLLRNLVAASTLGVLFAGVAWRESSMMLLSLVPALQLLTFGVAGSFLPAGRQKGADA